jgi:alkylation response protein AidB-like acyl-CoA dehydrogenase
MTAYAAPLADMRFVLNHVAGLDEVARLPGCADASAELVDQILEEAGKFGRDVLAPLNRAGDEHGCEFENGVVRTPPGFKEAYARFVEGGWNGVPFDPEYGGQGLPWLVSTAVSEIWNSANMAFALCPLLTQGAIELLLAHGSPEKKTRYLPKMVSGAWNGTMNLTEPQAGSDLARVRTKAERDGDHYRITGQKIFITYGEHDLTENIVHMVLARTPDAPAGIKGISLFIVPKFLVKNGGTLGPRNDLRCVSIEHKLGIHASPTAVMSYGDNGGAIGFLVGEENRGIEYMFTMMNNARLAVGLEGVAIAERAYQQAHTFARERVQGRAIGSDDPNPVPIIRHPDVKRMLLSMRAQTEAVRALAYFAAASLDIAKRHPDPGVRRERQALVDFLIPVVKAWSTDVGIEAANTGIQVHGGMGYVEETGAAQHLRDARIAAIYEGTNGIQANDLVGRKVGREHGATALAFIAMVRALENDLAAAPDSDRGDLAAIRARLAAATQALADSTAWVAETYAADPAAVAASAVPYLRLTGLVAGGWLMARSALAATTLLAQGDGDEAFLKGKIVCAQFFADQLLVQAPGLAETVRHGAKTVLRMAEERP